MTCAPRLIAHCRVSKACYRHSLHQAGADGARNFSMIHPVVKYGNAVLEKHAETVTVFDKELSRLLDDMFESMYAAQGVGLAAPQIGISRRIAVIDITSGKDPKAKLVLINPEIISTEGKQYEEEGC